MSGVCASGVRVYGRSRAGHGGRSAGLDVEGLSVLVTSDSADDDARALRIANEIAEGARARLAAEAQVRTLREALDRKDAQLREATTALEAAATGRRRFFTAVLCVPAEPGEWTGPVWLQDPVKGDSGHALRFASLAEVRLMHPELWIVGMTERGILLDAFALTTEAR